MQDETQGEDLEARLDTEDPQKIDLRGLKLLREDSLVVAGEMFLEGEHHAVSNDGEKDGILEGRPLNYKASVLPYAIIFAQNEERRGAFMTPAPARPTTLVPTWCHDYQTRYLKNHKFINVRCYSSFLE